jgi:putative Holliday junction resolvase
MPRILAVDFGERRIGLATSDASGSLATPRVTLLRKSDEVVLEELARFAGREEIAVAVFGIPRSPEGVESPIAGRIRSFAAKFERRTGLPVRFHEETLTSDEAARRLPRRATKEDVDRAAAAVLLEDYLASGGGEWTS